MGLFFQNEPASPAPQSTPKPTAPGANAPQTAPKSASAPATQQAAPQAAKPQVSEGSLAIKKLWVDGVIQNGVFFHLILLADVLPPAHITLDCDVEITHIGLFNNESTVLRTNGPKPRKLSVVHRSDGSGKPKAKRLEDGTYEIEFSLEYSGASDGINGNIKRGTHRLSVSITGDALKAPFACVDEFKV
ncbi:MAG: DUF3597 domain-containing protein [Ruminococcaceae bacterium]|nr:DUF3597 domain-containing protein [Oscillospiraceae bacterium]